MLKRIPIEHLRIGMYVHELCGSWMEHPFWRSAFLLENHKDLQTILDCGIKELWIDSARGRDVEAGQAREIYENATQRQMVESAKVEPPVLLQRVGITQELQRAARVYSHAKEAVTVIFQEARLGKALDAESALPLVEDITASVSRNPGALVSLVRLKNKDDYTYMHSVAVCALMVALARQLNLDEEQTRQAGLAGLLHDIGKMWIPNEILNKPGKLSIEEFEIMKTHPAQGFNALQEGRGVGAMTLDVCLHHHEKIDGSGYPKGLRDAEISLYARMGAICDVYDAITSNRAYKNGWDPGDAIRRMAEWRTGHFDPKVFQAFVKSVGIYPIGSLVRLESGRVGVVIEQSDKSLLTPKVRVFFSTKSGTHIPPSVIELSRPGCQDKIAGYEDAARWNIQHTERYMHPVA